MVNKLLSKLISRLKGEDYKVAEVSLCNLFILLFEKAIQLCRGLLKGMFFRKRKGLVFIGKHVTLKHSNKLYCGKSLMIGDGVYINALSEKGVFIGDNVTIGRNTMIECTGVIRRLGEELIIGDRVGISPNCFINMRGRIRIGNDTLFGPNVCLVSENHHFQKRDQVIRTQGETRLGIDIGKDCWLGMNVTVLDGITIGDGCVIGAGAVVTKDIPPYSVAVGAPARVLKERG